MEFYGVLASIVKEAKAKKRRIVLPEALDERILNATKICTDDDIADIILIGNEQEINKKCNELNIKLDFNKVKIEDPLTSINRKKYVEGFYELRKNKGIDINKAEEILKDNMYFATMMVKMSDADGLVSGATHSTADTLRPALQIIKARQGVKSVSSFFIIESNNKEIGENGVFIFSDCGLIEFPTEDELVDITLASRDSFKALVKATPKIALLSYSTKGSAKSEAIDKLNRVLEKVKAKDTTLLIDGELQLDAAIIKEVAKMKAPSSTVAGNANILIFPDLQSGNIGYKIAQRFGNCKAFGPITQGLAKPVNDLSRGCNTEDIVGAVAITCAQVIDE